MVYVDGFVLVVPKKNMKEYKKMATMGGKMWMKRGALSYVETVSEDIKPMMEMPEGSPPMPMPMNFLKLANAGKNDVVVFSFITFKNRKHRDKVNKMVMDDMAKAYAGKENDPMPFDPAKSAYGGFESIVNK